MSRSRMSPDERMLMVLTRLRRRPSHVWPVRALRRGIPGYEEGLTGDRNWQLDCAALRALGLAKRAPTVDGRRGIRYGPPVKPGELHLSQREHYALVRARRARGIPAIPNPMAGDTTRGTHLETLAAALRLLEEAGDWMTVGALARVMGERPARLLAILKLAWFLDVDGWSSYDQLLTGDLYDEEGRELAPSLVQVCVVRGDPEAPLEGKGLALLGIGAYTLEETAERLALIDDVLDAKLPGDATALESAKGKLLRWQHMLKAALDSP